MIVFPDSTDMLDVAKPRRNILIFGRIKLELDSHRVFVDNAIINLRNKEFSLLLYLMRNVGRVVSRTQILEDVWDHNIFCITNTVDVHISSLRRKITQFGADCYIKTVNCIGYIFDPNY